MRLRLSPYLDSHLNRHHHIIALAWSWSTLIALCPPTQQSSRARAHTKMRLLSPQIPTRHFNGHRLLDIADIIVSRVILVVRRRRAVLNTKWDIKGHNLHVFLRVFHISVKRLQLVACHKHAVVKLYLQCRREGCRTLPRYCWNA